MDGKTVIRVSCDDQTLKITEAPIVASGGLNETVVTFTFCEKWDGFANTCVFYRDEEEPYPSVVDESGVCVVPHEVYDEPGYFYFSVFGNKDDIRRTTNTLRYKAQKGVSTKTMIPSDPTPEVYDQIMSEVAKTRQEQQSFVTDAKVVIDDARESTSRANAAAESANAATENANTATTNANQATQNANTAAQSASMEAEKATKATDDANTATTNANNAANDARTATQETNTARENLMQAADDTMEAIKAAMQNGNDAPPIVCTAEGEYITVKDSAERMLRGLKLYGKTTQEGIPTPTSSVPFKSIGTNGSINVSVSQSGQNVAINVSKPLRGIPINSGKNDSLVTYTDSSGQKWIADEIDLARGVYIQRVITIVLDGTETWTRSSSGGFILGASNYGALYNFLTDANYADAFQLCSRFKSVAYYDVADCCVISFGGSLGMSLLFRYDTCPDIASWKAYLAELHAAGTPVSLILVRNVAKTTALSEDVKAQLYSLYTSNGESTISNDASAHMEVSYVADTKLYIDNKFSELAAAIVNNV